MTTIKNKKNKSTDKDKVIFLNGFIKLVRESHVYKFYSVEDSLQRFDFKDGTSITTKLLMELISK